MHDLSDLLVELLNDPLLCSMQCKTYPRPLVVWSTVNGIAIGLHLCISYPLWMFHVRPGDMYWRGPGEGMYFFFLLVLPWVGVMLVNVGVVIAAFIGRWSKPWKKVQLILVVLWMLVAAFEFYAVRAPEGAKYMGR